MTRLARAAAPAMVAVVVASCGLASTGFNGTPADVYSVIPSMSAVQKLLGDSNWWAGAPSFAVRPLDAETTPATQRFSVSQTYLHLGSSEALLARYTVYDMTSSAITAMSNLQTNLGASPSSPKVGDQVLYYGLAGTGGAPYVTRTYVRVGQILVQIAWSHKDGLPTVSELGRNATKFVAGLRNLNRVHVSPRAVDAIDLPPPGFDITLLGTAQLPVESFVAMTQSAIPSAVLSFLQGIDHIAYGDYALNNDTHMEVQTALLTFSSSTDASTFASTFGPGTADTTGIYNGYIPGSGTPAAGEYRYVFAAGTSGVLLICKPSLDGEAASRECETPMHTTAVAWKIALGG